MLPPFGTSVTSGDLVRLIEQLWAVTVAFAVADTDELTASDDVPVAVAMFVVVELITRAFVSV